MHIKTPFLTYREQGAVHGLLDAHQPRSDGMRRKIDGLMLDVGEGTSAQIADQVRRNTKDSADFLHLEFPRFEELRLVVRQRDGREGHVLFENGDLRAVGGAAIGRVPAFPQALGVLDGVRVRQDAAGASAILEKGAAVFLGGDSQADGVFLQRDGAVAHDAVKAQAGDVQHVLRSQMYCAALRGGVGIG